MPRTKAAKSPAEEILSALVMNKELEQYRLPKATSLSYRTILRTLKPLEELGDIKLLRTEPSEKGGKEKKVYSITLKGIWGYFETFNAKNTPRLSTPENKKKLEKIINLFPDMLLFFKKYPLFVEAGLNDIMLDYFILSLHITFHNYYEKFRLLKEGLLPSKMFDDFDKIFSKNLAEQLDYGALVYPLFQQELREKIRVIYDKDTEITAFVRDCLEQQIAILRVYEETLEWFDRSE